MRIIRVDSQIITSMAHCPFRAENTFVRRLIRKDGPSKAILMGTAVHLGLQAYYAGQKSGMSYDERVDVGIDKASEFLENNSLDQETKQTVLNTLADYFKYRRHEKMIVLEVESPFSVVIYEGEDLMGNPIKILYEGKIDLICDENNERVVIDHKTTSVNFEPIDLKVQFLGYHWATGLKVIVNRIGFQKTLRPEDKFKRFPMKFEPAVVEAFTKFVVQKSLEWALYLEANTFPQNFASCQTTYGPCTYINICRYPTLREETERFEFEQGPEWDVFSEVNT